MIPIRPFWISLSEFYIRSIFFLLSSEFYISGNAIIGQSNTGGDTFNFFYLSLLWGLLIPPPRSEYLAEREASCDRSRSYRLRVGSRLNFLPISSMFLRSISLLRWFRDTEWLSLIASQLTSLLFSESAGVPTDGAIQGRQSFCFVDVWQLNDLRRKIQSNLLELLITLPRELFPCN